MFDRVEYVAIACGFNPDLIDGQRFNPNRIPEDWEIDLDSTNRCKNDFIVSSKRLKHRHLGVTISRTNNKPTIISYCPARVLHDLRHNARLPQSQEELDESWDKLVELIKPVCYFKPVGFFRYVEIAANIGEQYPAVAAMLDGVTHPVLRNWHRYGGSSQGGTTYGSKKGADSRQLSFYDQQKRYDRRDPHGPRRRSTRCELTLKGGKIAEAFNCGNLIKLEYDRARQVLLDEVGELDAKLIRRPKKLTPDCQLYVMMRSPASGLDRKKVDNVYGQFLNQGKGDSTVRRHRASLKKHRRPPQGTSLRQLVKSCTRPKPSTAKNGS